jgi:hypothetical protein
MENGKITFIASEDEDWQVYELIEFLHQMNILYNRLFVLDKYSVQVSEKISYYMKNSLGKVPESKRLIISTVTIRSPAKITLEGSGEIISEIREASKDFLYRNKIEKERMSRQLEHETRMNEIEQKAAELKLVSEQINILKKMGYTDEDIRNQFLKNITQPLEKIIEISINKNVGLLKE